MIGHPAEYMSVICEKSFFVAAVCLLSDVCLPVPGAGRHLHECQMLHFSLLEPRKGCGWTWMFTAASLCRSSPMGSHSLYTVEASE